MSTRYNIKLDHFRLMGERTNGSHTILEVEHQCFHHLRHTSSSNSDSIQHRFSRLVTVIPGSVHRQHESTSPPLNAHSSVFGLACSCLETSFFLPVWMYSLPSKICAVPMDALSAGRLDRCQVICFSFLRTYDFPI